MVRFNTYELTALLSAIIIFIMGICLVVVSVPQNPELRNYRISRWLLAGAYIILASVGFAGVFFTSKVHEDVTVALFQALLFTYALITLLNHNFVNTRRLLSQLSLILLISGIIAYNTLFRTSPIEELSYITTGCYFTLFGYYIWQFFREYRRYKQRVADFQPESEQRLLIWVKHIYIIVIIIGILAGIITDNNIYFLLFIMCYTVVYVYMAVKYINYLTDFHRIALIVFPTHDKSTATANTDTSIEQWNDTRTAFYPDYPEKRKEQLCVAIRNILLNEKGYRDPALTRDILIERLGTNKKLFIEAFQHCFKMSFSEYLNHLRLQDAVTLLEESDLAIEEISEKAGFGTVRTFQRQFQTKYKMPPKEYRKAVAK